MIINTLFNISATFSTIMLIASFLMLVAHLVKADDIADRVLALDMLVTIGVGFIAIIAIIAEQTTYIDVAITLGLVGFLSTAAFARYITECGLSEEKQNNNKKNENEKNHD